MQKLMEYPAIPAPWQTFQLHLAERPAFCTREILPNPDQSVEARNMVQKQVEHAQLLQSISEEVEETMSKLKFVIPRRGVR